MFIGIDCSLEKHNYCIKEKINQVIAKGIIRNTHDSVRKFVRIIDKFEIEQDNILIGIESTNNYHLSLVYNLRQEGLGVIILSPSKTSRYSKIDNDCIKTDPIDAEGITDFLIKGMHVKTMPFNQKYPLLRELCRAWIHLQRDQTRIAARIHSRLVVINPEFTQYFSDNFSASGIYILENYKSAIELAIADVDKLQFELDKITRGFSNKKSAQEIIDLAKNSFGMKEGIDGFVEYVQHQLRMYKNYQEEIKQLKKQIRNECKKDYCKQEIKLMTSIKGVSEELAAGILSEIGDIDNFSKRSAIARFAGLITTSKDSGQMIGKKKLTKKGSPFLRHYLHQAMMTTKLHTKAFSAWYTNKLLKIGDLEPNQKKVYRAKYRGALTRRLLDQLYLCLKHNREFDDDIAFRNLELRDEIRELVSVKFNKN